MGELPDIREDLVDGSVDNSMAHQRYGGLISQGSLLKKNRKKQLLGGPMNKDEIRMNKGLLKEIS